MTDDARRKAVALYCKMSETHDIEDILHNIWVDAIAHERELSAESGVLVSKELWQVIKDGWVLLRKVSDLCKAASAPPSIDHDFVSCLLADEILAVLDAEASDDD